MQILNQFKDEGLEPDLVDMQRYAAWKAADIRKALREGRSPTPGAPGGDVPTASTITISGLLLPLYFHSGKQTQTNSQLISVYFRPLYFDSSDAGNKPM